MVVVLLGVGNSSSQGGGNGLCACASPVLCRCFQYCLCGGGEIRSGCHGSHKTNNERDIEGDN